MLNALTKKGYGALPAEDKTWADRVTGKNYGQMMENAAVEDNVPRLKYVTDNFAPSLDAKRETAEAAAASGAIGTLRHVLSLKPSGFADTGAADGRFVARLMEKAAEAQSLPVWQELAAYNAARTAEFPPGTRPGPAHIPFLVPEKIVGIAVAANFMPGIDHSIAAADLNRNAQEMAAVSQSALRHATDGPHIAPATLERVLKWNLSFVNRQSDLDKGLVRVSKEGEFEKAEMLLKHKANPSYNGCEALIEASLGDHLRLRDLLVRNGGDVRTRDPNNKDLPRLPSMVGDQLAEMAAVEEDRRRVGIDPLMRVQRLSATFGTGAGRTLQVVFSAESGAVTRIDTDKGRGQTAPAGEMKDLTPRETAALNNAGKQIARVVTTSGLLTGPGVAKRSGG